MKYVNWRIFPVACLAVAAAATFVACTPAETPAPTTPDATLDGQLGVIDSIFPEDNVLDNTATTPDSDVPTTPTETKPESPDPDIPDAPQNPTEGLQDPDSTEPPDETQPITTKPAETTPSPAIPVGSLTYTEFWDLTPEQQQAYQASFESLDAFFQWYNAAVEQHEAENPPIVIGPDGVVDLDKVGGN